MSKDKEEDCRSYCEGITEFLRHSSFRKSGIDPASPRQRGKFFCFNQAVGRILHLETDIAAWSDRPEVWRFMRYAEFEVAVILRKTAVLYRMQASSAALLQIAAEFDQLRWGTLYGDSRQ